LELIEDEPMKKIKTLALKSNGKSTKALEMAKSEEETLGGETNDGSKDEEMTLLSKRFTDLANKRKKRVFNNRSGFRCSTSKERNDDQNNFYNHKKPDNFIVDCPELQKDRPKKRSSKKDNTLERNSRKI
jgi:hypothetical protein